MLPRVIVYDAVSLDGRIEGFEPDIGRFYSMARWGEEVILAGADTMLAGGEASAAPDDPASPPPEPAEPAASGPLLAIVDSRGRFRSWDWVRAQHAFWRDAVALVSEGTSQEYLAHLASRGVSSFTAGTGRVRSARRARVARRRARRPHRPGRIRRRAEHGAAQERSRGRGGAPRPPGRRGRRSPRVGARGPRQGGAVGASGVRAVGREVGVAALRGGAIGRVSAPSRILPRANAEVGKDEP